MKIKFLIGFPIKTFATEWQEINDFGINDFAPNRETFNLFKALEHNQDIDEELRKARKKLRLPVGGLTWEQFKQRKDTKADLSKEELENIIYFIHNHYKEISKIKRKLQLHPQVEEQLENLILGNFVEPKYRDIIVGCNGANVHDYESMDDFDEHTEVDEVSVVLTKRASKNELLKFIDDNWNDIKKLMEMLPQEERFYISQRDLRIVELRDKQRMKYKDIADTITTEFSIEDISGAINEDSVKTSYKRARTKIDTLAKSNEK
ncbi:MAG: hypothetical protein M3Q81_00235 [bacterium]|nr:hypothetical protein [bacterium]